MREDAASLLEFVAGAADDDASVAAAINTDESKQRRLLVLIMLVFKLVVDSGLSRSTNASGTNLSEVILICRLFNELLMPSILFLCVQCKQFSVSLHKSQRCNKIDVYVMQVWVRCEALCEKMKERF